MSISNSINELHKLYDKSNQSNLSKKLEFKFRFIGSSLGGLIAARYAELYPERVDKLILLAPAFEIVKLWDDLLLNKETIENWKNQNILYFKMGRGGHELDEGQFSAFKSFEDGIKIEFLFYKDALENHTEFPKTKCPITIIHGDEDTQVPVSSSQKYCEENKDVKLIIVKDDHGLSQSIPEIENQISTFFNN